MVHAAVALSAREESPFPSLVASSPKWLFSTVPIFVANVKLVSETRISQLSSGVSAFPPPRVHAHVR